MFDVFSLNYCGPNFSIVKKDHKKEIEFIPGEHAEIFAVVYEIYKKAKLTLVIIGLVPLILAEEENKEKGQVAYESKWDSLARFCGPIANHACVSSFKPLVGFGEEGYNMILKSFRNNGAIL